MSRSRALAVVAGLALIGAAARAAAPAGAPRSADWNRFLGPGLDGKSPEVGIRTDWSGDRLPLVWQREVGDGYSMPSIAAGRLFLFDRYGDRARLSCLRSDTGEELWRSEHDTDYVDSFGYSGGPRASPVVDGDRVYTLGVEGLLRAHRASDGELLWQVDTAKKFRVVQNFFGVGSTPVIEGDLLIAMLGGSPPDSPSIESGKVRGAGSGVVAFDKATGEVRYRITDELASYSSPVVRGIGDRRWGFVFARGGLVGFEPATGEVDFHFPWRSGKLYSVNAASPVVVGDRVLITESYGPGSALLRVRPGGYEIVRTDPPRRGQSLAAHWSTPIHHQGYLYGSSGEKSGGADLRCIDFETGELQWSEKLGRVTLLYVDSHLVVLTERGRLLLVRALPESFQPVTEIDLGQRLGLPTWNAPILSHGLLYVRGARRLLAFELIANARSRSATSRSAPSRPTDSRRPSTIRATSR